MGNKYFYTYIQNDEFREGRVVAGERSMTTNVEEKTTRHKTDIYKKKKKKKNKHTHQLQSFKNKNKTIISRSSK